MNRREAEELLPWFVTGTLSDEESVAVQAFIDSGEISTAELNSLEMVAETVSERSAEEPAYEPAILQRAMGQLDGIKQEQADPPLVVGEVASSQQDRPGFFQQLIERLQWSSTPPLARIVVAGQFALLLGLTVMLAGQITSSDETDGGFDTVAGTGAGPTADFTLSFATGSSEADTRALLLTHELRIVDGPSALGIYRVAAARDADLAALSAALSDHPLVGFLQEVPRP